MLLPKNPTYKFFVIIFVMICTCMHICIYLLLKTKQDPKTNKETLLLKTVHIGLYFEKHSCVLSPQTRRTTSTHVCNKTVFLCVFDFFFFLIQTFVHFLTKLQLTTTFLKSFLVGKYCKIFLCNYHVFTGPHVSDFQ